MGRITTVIFDMFNTLVEDGETYWMASFQRIVQEQNLKANAIELRKEWSSGDQAFRDRRTNGQLPFQTYYNAWLGGFERTFAALELNGDPADAVRIVLEDMGQRPIHTDTVQALELLQEQCHIAVLSNADDRFLNPVVERLGISFEAVLSSEAAQCYKPRPELFHNMLRRLDVSPQEAVYVGDRQYEDVQGASKAGMRAIWLNRDRVALDPNLTEPDHHVESLLEIPTLVDR
ncbi:MAG: HAD family hydrolase [Chloroflexi bacterium]|nr:HAD family hydrolase [Chloroflexota bacterium]MDA1219372.1 HAD family hydrolase [Chloroflexota bacterium]PKB57658.1 MAG: hypothetical protein BZY73_02015 [SAR202 cluster bacterium Casp-Chloro-G3]